MGIIRNLIVGVFCLALLAGFLVVVASSFTALSGKEDIAIHTTSIAVFLCVFLVGFGGIAGGLVHALESEKNHVLLLNGEIADTGASGHMFIGFCGSYVALAVVMVVFGMDIGNALDAPAKVSLLIKYIFYLFAIGVVGGYSGLPIISLVSNAALKKVQEQVDELKKSEELTKENVSELDLKNDLLNRELDDIKLQNVLLKAESLARNEEFTKAIELILNDFLPFNNVDSQKAKAFHWLALCEKRRGCIEKAIDYVNDSIAICKSRLGYFNLACYTWLKDKDPKSVITLLKLASKHADTKSEINRLLKGLQEDPDLGTLRELELSEINEIIQELELRVKS
jgi:hypothetical protein